MKTRLPEVSHTEKMATGIQGFDEITYGGIPRGRTTLLMGGAGCGKTVLALQTLINCAHQQNVASIFVAFEESPQQIVANAATFEWDLPKLQKSKLIFFLDAGISPDVVNTGHFDLIGLLALIRAKAQEIDATQIVFDGIDVLLNLLNDPTLERRELFRLRDWLGQNGYTGIITQKVSGGSQDQSYGFLQFMVDCVVVLRHQVVEGSAFRNLRIVKYRGSEFWSDEFPISLTGQGLRLTNRGPTEFKYEVTGERISSGLARLDTMLQGGYYRGSNILISGAPGSAKSTLSSLFALSACEHGQRTLYVSFDEGAAQIVRNLNSVGIGLAPHVKSGLLRMYSTRTRGPNVEDQFSALRAQVRAHQPRCMIIDPLSALSTKLSHVASADAAQQFLDFLKVEGITVVNTSLLDGVNTDEITATGISTIADTWIHLSYVVQDGERNRALTIVKSRGTGHSNQVRELTLSNEGVSLTDVFVAHGRVLMGVARWEWEQEQRAAKLRERSDAEHKRIGLELAQAEAGARLQVIRTEMEARSAEIAVLESAAASAFTLLRADQDTLRKLRHADDEVVAGAAEVSPLKKKRAKRGL